MSIEAMKQALEALYLFATDESPEGYEAISAITTLRTAIEQAEKSQDIKSGIETVAAKGGLLPKHPQRKLKEKNT
jgi:hypothetical protein